jgi:hypothetical protein
VIEARRAHVARGGRSGSNRGDAGLYFGEEMDTIWSSLNEARFAEVRFILIHMED